jgi:hypothetical protein
MGRIIAASILQGAVFGTLVATVTAFVLWCYWGSQSGGQPGIALMALIFWVPAIAIFGGVFATALFGVVGMIMSLRPFGLEPSAISYALLGSLLAYGILILYAAGGWFNGVHALWHGGGLRAVLHGAQGFNDGFVRLLLPPIVIAGLLVGRKVRAQQ